LDRTHECSLSGNGRSFQQEVAPTLPIGIAYAVWVGIGPFSTIARLTEPATPRTLFFLGLLMIAIIGLKWSARNQCA